MDIGAVTGAFSAVPGDWLILGGIAVLAALDCLRSGAHRLATLALALPPAFLVYTMLPEAAILGDAVRQFSTPPLAAVLFFILVALFYVLVGRIGLSWGGGAGQTIQAALTGVVGAALIAVFWLQVPALDSLWHFGGSVQEIFGESYRALWLIASFAVIAFVHRS